ncbi:hypothetical protein RA272_28735, partial [Pseudomonas syringae pv. tagetis]|uniref:hypothetical protein n=1 Tax=Pseudomonas syringae group genomosp. 7 TaxID=251699 RepID=UPI00376F477D
VFLFVVGFGERRVEWLLDCWGGLMFCVGGRGLACSGWGLVSVWVFVLVVFVCCDGCELWFWCVFR